MKWTANGAVSKIGGVTLGLVACVCMFVTAHAADRADEYVSVHILAVASTIGDTYTLYNKGLTIFQNSAEKVPVHEWKIDEFIVSAISQVLSPRYTVVPAQLGAESSIGCNDQLSLCLGLPNRSDIDAYVIVIPRTLNDPSGSPRLRGLGQFHSGGPFGLHYDAIYAGYMLVVADKNGHVIDYGSAWASDFTPFGADEPMAGPLPASAWPGTGAAMTEDQKAFAKSTLMRLISTSLPHAIKNANLGAPPRTAP